MLKNSAFLILLLLISCKNSFGSKEDMNAFISDTDNGLLEKKDVNGVYYSLRYRPTDLLVEQELGNSKDKKKVQILRKKYRRFIYFNLSISKNSQELLNDVEKEKFAETVNDLVFRMDQKVHLITPEKDTIPMMDFIYPRMYGSTDATTIMFVYPRENKIMEHNYLTLVIDDLGFYTGEVKFKINPKVLQNEPTLNF
jgi:hypothetical protein